MGFSSSISPVCYLDTSFSIVAMLFIWLHLALQNISVPFCTTSLSSCRTISPFRVKWIQVHFALSIHPKTGWLDTSCACLDLGIKWVPLHGGEEALNKDRSINRSIFSSISLTTLFLTGLIQTGQKRSPWAAPCRCQVSCCALLVKTQCPRGVPWKQERLFHSFLFTIPF